MIQKIGPPSLPDLGADQPYRVSADQRTPPRSRAPRDIGFVRHQSANTLLSAMSLVSSRALPRRAVRHAIQRPNVDSHTFLKMTIKLQQDTAHFGTDWLCPGRCGPSQAVADRADLLSHALVGSGIWYEDTAELTGFGANAPRSTVLVDKQYW